MLLTGILADSNGFIRVVAWNVNHTEGYFCSFKEHLVAAALPLNPSLVIFTEYVKTRKKYGHAHVCAELRREGFQVIELSQLNFAA
jgi:hypothetical protein